MPVSFILISPVGVDPLLSRVRIRKSHSTSWEILRLVTVYNATVHVLLCWVTLMPGSDHGGSGASGSVSPGSLDGTPLVWRTGMHYFSIFDISPKRYLRLLGRNGSEEDRESAEESEDRPEEVELEDENPWAFMTTGLHQNARITEDVHLRILECAHPRWYDHLLRLSHKLSVE